jgi:hypothetical protein
MTDQYKNSTAAPKLIPNARDKKDKDLTKQVRDLDEKIQDQARLIHRMHRDIVRIRADIDNLHNKVK